MAWNYFLYHNIYVKWNNIINNKNKVTQSETKHKVTISPINSNIRVKIKGRMGRAINVTMAARNLINSSNELYYLSLNIH